MTFPLAALAGLAAALAVVVAIGAAGLFDRARQAEDLAAEGYRVLAFACRDWDRPLEPLSEERLETAR